MGMFDSLICEYPLPDFPEQWILDGFDIGDVYQTKSLDCGLDMYKINIDGRLYKRSDWDREFWFDIYHHGELVFYTNATDENDRPAWLQYRAKFVKGQLASIRRQYVEWGL